MDLEEARRRQHAYLMGESVRARDTAVVTRRRPVLGIVPVGAAGDLCLQALAFGRLDGEPIVHRFPERLRQHPPVYELVASEILALLAQDDWQIWLLDQDARLVLALEAERLRDNPAMPLELEVFARMCEVIFHQSQTLEQQVVVVATEVLGAHLTPGQSPTEDGHLGLRLAWDNPVHVHPLTVAEKRRKKRGPTWLPSADDEKMQAIEARVFSGTATSKHLRKEVNILHKALSESWEMLQQAHKVYRQLPVPDLPGLEVVADQSWKDFMARVAASPSVGAPATSTPEED